MISLETRATRRTVGKAALLGAGAGTGLLAGCDDPRRRQPSPDVTDLDPVRRTSYETYIGEPVASYVIPRAVVPYLLNPDLPQRIGDRQAVTGFWNGLVKQIAFSGDAIFKEGSAELGISIGVNRPRTPEADPLDPENPYNQAEKIGIAVINKLLEDPTVQEIVTAQRSGIDNYPFVTEPPENLSEQPLEFRVDLLSLDRPQQ